MGRSGCEDASWAEGAAESDFKRLLTILMQNHQAATDISFTKGYSQTVN